MEMETEKKEIETTEVSASVKVGNTDGKKLFIKGLLIGVGVLLIIIFFGFGYVAFRIPDAVPFAGRVMRALNMPAAYVNGSVITWRDVETDSEALGKYIASQQGFPSMSADEIRTRVLHRLMLAAVAADYADQHGLKVDDNVLNAQMGAIAQSVGGKEKFISLVETQYGMTYDLYRDRVVKQSMLLDELAKYVTENSEINKEAREKIDALLSDIRDKKISFEDAAKQNSQDTSAEQGGDLGWVKRGQTVESFEDTAFGTAKGQVSDVVVSQFGFHIIKIDEVKKTGDEITEVRARHILLKSQPLNDFLQSELDRATVWQLIGTKKPAAAILDSLAVGG